MPKCLIDTCVIIDYLRGKDDAVSFLENLKQAPVISAVTVAELYAGFRGDTEREQLDDFIKNLSVVSISPEISKQAGLFRNQFHKSHGVGLMDAMIGATALSEELPLLTLNTKHFPMISDVVRPY